MNDEAASHLGTIDELLAANEQLRMERDVMNYELVSLKEEVRGQVEADLLLASFRIIADLILKHEPSPDDVVAQKAGVHTLNAMRSDAAKRTFAQPPGRPQGPNNLPNPYARRSA